MAKVVHQRNECDHGNYLIQVEVVTVHDDTIRDKNFSISETRQIAWWESIEDMIQATYGISDRSQLALPALGFINYHDKQFPLLPFSLRDALSRVVKR